MFVDRAKNNLGVGGGGVLKSLEGEIFEQWLKLNFLVINNEVDYKAFITGFRSASKLKAFELWLSTKSWVNLKLKEPRWLNIW